MKQEGKGIGYLNQKAAITFALITQLSHFGLFLQAYFQNLDSKLVFAQIYFCVLQKIFCYLSGRVLFSIQAL